MAVRKHASVAHKAEKRLVSGNQTPQVYFCHNEARNGGLLEESAAICIRAGAKLSHGTLSF